MTTAWAHLPNARHIDAVLAHVKTHPKQWGAARCRKWRAAWYAARDVAWQSNRIAQWCGVRYATVDAAKDCKAWGHEWNARDACYALVAWDDAGPLMDVPLDAVRTLAAAGHRPAILLLPARLAMEETA